MSNCPPPRQPNPFPGELTGTCLPPSTFNGKPLPYTASSVVPMIAGSIPYYSSQYTDAIQQGNMYVSMSTIAGQSGLSTITFKSQEDRIKYLKGQLFFRPTC
jgi:hypothetical protein